MHVHHDASVQGFHLRHLTLSSESNWAQELILRVSQVPIEGNLHRMIWTLRPYCIGDSLGFVKSTHVRFERFGSGLSFKLLNTVIGVDLGP